ncbi:hypothetical protein V6667_04935 [Neisseria leonii]|uniref:hypothetical protein n=1 Tax=Neisseria leonii TaxID=2995413 RepID=UPI0030D4DFCC
MPYFAAAGTGIVDAGNGKDTLSGITPLWSLNDNHNQINSQQLTIMARRKNADHGAMLHDGDGYMTEWFAYTLTADRDAAKAFTGSRPEILENSLWQDVHIK